MSTRLQAVAQTTDIHWPRAATRTSNGNPDHGHIHMNVRLQYGLGQWVMGYQHDLQGQQGPERSSKEVQARKLNILHLWTFCCAEFWTSGIAHAQYVSGLSVSSDLLHTILSVLFSNDIAPSPIHRSLLSHLHHCCAPLVPPISTEHSPPFLHLS